MIYFIQCGGRRGPVKIGFTEYETRKRLMELQVSTPYRLKILGEMQGKLADERRIQAIFKDSKIGGEWFKFTDSLGNFIESTCGLAPDDAMMKLIMETEKTAEDIINTNFNLPSKLKDIERTIIIAALKKSNWVQSKAALMLGIGRSGLNQKIKQYAIKQDFV